MINVYFCFFETLIDNVTSFTFSVIGKLSGSTHLPSVRYLSRRWITGSKTVLLLHQKEEK